jgi:hypothetical protein
MKHQPEQSEATEPTLGKLAPARHVGLNRRLRNTVLCLYGKGKTASPFLLNAQRPAPVLPL